MLRRIVGITGISLWAGLILVLVASKLKADVDEIFQNLPEGWKIEKSVTVPKDQTLAFSRKLRARISKLTNTYLSIDEQPLQVNVVHCSTTRGAERAFKAIVEEHGGHAISAALYNNSVIEFANCDDTKLIKQARVALGFPPYQLDSTAAKLIKNIPDGWEVEDSFIVPQEQIPATEEKLGAQIKSLSNTIFSIQGKRFQVNIIECPMPRTAETIYKSIRKIKGDPAFCLRHRNMVVEFVTDDIELARKAPSELGLRPKTRSAKLRTDRLDINAKVAKLNFRTATLDHVIQIFGKPLEYTWENQTLTKDNLPTTYLLSYPNGFSVLINDGRISELQHTQPGYIWQGKLQVGDSLEKALEVIGQPKQTVAGQAKPELFEDCILYKDINSKQGNCCYSHKIKGVRLLFTNNRISALYVTRSDFSGRRAAGTAAKAPFDTAPEETGIEALARDFIKLLVEGDFSKATENFDKTMKKELPAEKLQQVWNSIIAQVGPFVEQLAVRKEKILQYKAVFVTCKFEKGVLDAKVVYNTEKQISGLFFVPSQNLEDN